MNAKPYFDLLLIVPLEEELEEILKVFPHLSDLSTTERLVVTVDSGDPKLSILLTQLPAMGRSEAGDATRAIVGQYNIGIIVCIGIAGGLSKDLRLGDVCYSENILDVYEQSSVTDAEDGDGITVHLSPNQFRTPRQITIALNFLRSNPEINSKYKEWQQTSENQAKALLGDLSAETTGTHTPKSKNGNLVCGAVSKSSAYNAKLKAMDRNVLAIETESGGVFEQAEKHNIAALTIRGISDLADSNKCSLETSTKGVYRKIAAANAASFLRSQLANHYFTDLLQDFRNKKDGEEAPELFTKDVSPKNTILESLKQSEQEIQIALGELSPEYKLLDKGYRLPTPRIRSSVFENLFGETDDRTIEVREALERHKVVLVDIPRTYPDESLPWVIAENLLTFELNGKQSIPIVLDGNILRPPKLGIKSLAGEYDLEALRNNAGAQLVFIVSSVQLTSSTKRNFLISQMEEFEEAQFVLIARGQEQTLSDQDLVRSVGAEIHELCEVSFLSISQFLEFNFDLESSEAQVIALRLFNTFEQFDLVAHPTYFAGIPRETLYALLQANRRAELIQLAVDGFLSFVVAEDTSDITLSRTTRSRFLSNLAIEMDVEKRSFSQATLIKFTKDFATKFDFEIEPLKFVQNFVEKGILRFDDNNVSFTLPFIRSYLLASALNKDPSLAAKYFAPSIDDFDFAAFDLYAELGASDAVVGSIVEKLKSHATSLGEKSAAILSNDLRPNLVNVYEKTKTIQDGIQRKIEELKKNEDDHETKQKFLDLANRAGKKLSSERNENQKKATPKKSKDDKEFNELVSDWLIGTVLIGGAAENLTGSIKQDLAGSLIVIANEIIDHMTDSSARIDFVKSKSELLASPEVLDLVKNAPSDAEKEDILVHFSNLIDIVEFSFLAHPFRRVMQHLCEQSRNRVLSRSIEKATFEDGGIREIIRWTWLIDLDSKKGKVGILEHIKKLPIAPFFRFVLATHFLNRVYWSHGDTQSRGDLLTAANETIHLLGKGIDKKELLAIVSKVKNS